MQADGRFERVCGTLELRRAQSVLESVRLCMVDAADRDHKTRSNVGVIEIIDRNWARSKQNNDPRQNIKLTCTNKGHPPPRRLEQMTM
jgi:hypothetical protein